MANLSFHKILSYIGSIDYDLTNKLTIADIDKYHVLFVFVTIYIHRGRNHSLCYNFTYNQSPQSINIFVEKS